MVAVLSAAALCGACREDPPGDEPAASQAPWFEEVAAAAGVDFVHDRGPLRYWFPEIMGGGAAWCDLDGDGDLDLYLVQGGDLAEQGAGRPGNRYFMNLGGGRFHDATEAAGLGGTGYGMGVACGDADGDGDRDLYVTNWGPNELYRNLGDGTFREVAAEEGVDDSSWSASATFHDIDGDGLLDLYVTNYVHWDPRREIRCSSPGSRHDYCQPENYRAPAPDTLYLRGDGGFLDVSEASGIRSVPGNGLGVVAGDLLGDGATEIYVANDGDPNHLWRRQPDGTFEDEAVVRGVAVDGGGAPEASMGIALGDVDGDGGEDLLVTHLRAETDTFYRSAGEFFEDRSAGAGLAGPSLPLTGFGTGFLDFDLDGHLDLFVTHGRVGHSARALAPDDPFAEPDHLFAGRGDGTFLLVPFTAAGMAPANGRAAAFGDFDGDGDPDIVVSNNGGRARLFRNRAGDGREWIGVQVGGPPGVDAIGARIDVVAADGAQRRHLRTGYSYCASNDPRLQIGLGGAERVESLRVRWPDGRTRLLRDLAPNAYYFVRR